MNVRVLSLLTKITQRLYIFMFKVCMIQMEIVGFIHFNSNKINVTLSKCVSHNYEEKIKILTYKLSTWSF